MKIFLDTADLSEIRRATDAGLIDGITTNPSLVAKVAEGDVSLMYREICEAVDTRCPLRSSLWTVRRWSPKGVSWPRSTRTLS